MKRDKGTAKKKGWLATAAAGGSVAAIVLGAPWLGVFGLAGSAYLAYDWFKFRAERGMRV